MKLACREWSPESANGRALVILHGLLGSSRNWHTAARDLSRERRVLVPDLRNHGESPWSEENGFNALAGDIFELLDRREISRADVLGHSMGGKVAMRCACDQPQRVSHLIVVDVAPREYEAGSKELQAMAALDIAALSSRREAEEKLEASVPDLATRRFLLTNLAREGQSSWRWKANVEALLESLPEIRANPLAAGEHWDGPALFVAGGRSPFVRPEDHDTIRRHFSAAEIVVFDGIGHDVHVEAREDFVDRVARFLGAPDA